MEGKRTAAAAAALCCLLVVLLSGQPPPVAAMSKFKFCICYRACYGVCRKIVPGLPGVVCQTNCANRCGHKEPEAVPASAADCGRICSRLLKLCRMPASGEGEGEASEAGQDDVGGCVDDYTRNLEAFAPSASKIN
ncbi:hypothetical protein ACP4OV_021656 [Aristida adscensionis]